MKNRQELWPGQNVANLRSQILGTPKGAEGPKTFSGRGQKTVERLEAKHKIAQEGKPSVNDRLKWGKLNIQEHVEKILADDSINPDLGHQHIARIMAFDREMGLMPEKPRSQVQKVADAIAREFDLKSGKPSETAANNAITVRPEVLLTNATKDVLKSFSPESLALTPLILALMVVRKMPDGVKGAIRSFYEKLPVGVRLAFLMMLSGAVLAACSVAAGTPTKEVDPGNNNNPQAGETTGLPSETEESSSGSGSSSTAEAPDETPPESPTPDVEAQQRQTLIDKINAEIAANDYLTTKQQLNPNQELSKSCADEAFRLAREGQINLEHNTVNIDPFGDCRVVSDDGKQAIFPNDEGDLYVTEVGGRAFLAGINHSQASNATIKFDNLSGPWYGEMINSKTGEVLAVATRDAQRQWREMKNGQIVDEAGKPMIVPTATADAGSSEPGKTLDVRVADEATLNALADDILAQERKFPEGMPQSMNHELIDVLNEKIGPRPIYFEGVDKNGTKVVEYYDLEKRKMVQLRGSYLDEENKKKIDANSITLLRKLQTSPQTGLTSYFDETTQQWVEIKNSKGVDWNFVGSGELDESKISLPGHQALRESILDKAKEKDPAIKRSIVQFVVTNDRAAELKLNQGYWFTMGTIEGLTVQADQDGNPLFGVTIFVPPEGNLNLAFDDSEILKEVKYPEIYMQNGGTEFQPGTLFLITAFNNQEKVWEIVLMSSISDIPNVEDPENAFKEATNHSFGQKIIILTARTIWEKSP